MISRCIIPAFQWQRKSYIEIIDLITPSQAKHPENGDERLIKNI